MNSKVTVVMYHYVRDLENSRFPEIKGLDIQLFKEQIAYLKSMYSIITMEQLIEAAEGKIILPDRAALLTFDDAYIDHYTYVFPVLVENEIQGSFFPPGKAITEHTVLDVNKIHHILASCKDKHKLVDDIYELLDQYRDKYNLNSNEYYYNKLAVPNRFDTGEVIFIKRMLQVELQEELRRKLSDFLFEKYVGMSEASFSRELYMSVEQIKIMKRFGMHIGSHGYDHYWLNSLSREQQRFEIEKSIEFIKCVGGSTESWTMCFPYGGFNEDTLELLTEYKCKAAFSTNVDIADIKNENRLTLSRLDTNDLPKDRNAKENTWLDKVVNSK
ncbi:polysaccharide deacetylase family protein [Carboxylicivirga sediminis]|uniref:Polysaccharide deacetylase family protein n=1 Tax=Carboxylicivirga sediminis TaxID=2006564 RepID=A0A941IYV4_9BACT|nr:polysaccharide deacetylase family protein [Carboxylicivirga sediminis]MBR8537390.1 polysaccharide deacetylase family protein [Carboxylicivirga sediminis]